MNIRLEIPADQEAIFRINAEAFERDGEARLVDALRDAGVLTLSLVAEVDGAAVGHIAFSPVTIETARGSVDAIGLAPMSVLKVHQRTGVGSVLVREGLLRLTDAGHASVVVLGHPAFYPRFGFKSAQSTYGLDNEYGAPDEAFMALELAPGALEDVQGLVKYHSVFASV
ncbi:MAG: GNAT family N-acetyltransferase [Candidatus Hydrogenedentota bacterium]|nr:MAG: GNAT family N-acetyltransferase [Candidatus Hydrogenedentota bacterium]